MKTLRSIVLLSAALFAAGCHSRRTATDGSGTMECTQVQVASLVGGRILKLPPQEGDSLKRDALVAEIDAADYALRRAEAAAALAQAQAQLDLLLAGTREEDVLRGRAQLREAEALARAASADWERLEKVFKENSATRKQYDDAKAAAERAEASRAQAEQNLSRLVKGSRREEIRVAQTAVELAQARLATAEKAVADCRVCAPMDGVVTVRAREEGEIVGSGATLVTLSRLDEVWLAIYVPEARLARIQVGQRAWVKADGMNQAVEGKIAFISPEAEFTPRNVQTPNERAKLVYRVKIVLPNTNRVFKPGMPADGYLEAAP